MSMLVSRLYLAFPPKELGVVKCTPPAPVLLTTTLRGRSDGEQERKQKIWD